MYDFVLLLHSWLRWVVVILAVLVLFRALMGVMNKSSFTATDNKTSLFFMISCDVQLLIGLLLYVFLSPITATAFQDFGVAMKDPALRYFAVEHLSMMLIALVLVHIGRSRSKKAATDLAKHKALLIYYGIAVLLMLASIPWTTRPLFRM